VLPPGVAKLASHGLVCIRLLQQEQENMRTDSQQLSKEGEESTYDTHIKRCRHTLTKRSTHEALIRNRKRRRRSQRVPITPANN
jgi:pyruvate-formate lyase